MKTLTVHPLQGQLSGTCNVPGDKSVSHRSFLFGALANGPVEVRGAGTGEDNQRTRAIMEACGVTVEDVEPGLVRVHGVGLDGLRAPAERLNCGNSGTSIRLLCGVFAGQSFDCELYGDESLSRRPMRRVIDPLSQMGATIAGETGAKPREAYPPLRVTGQKLAGISYPSPVASAQVKSAILLAGLYAEGTTRVDEPGPSRDHTERMLRYMGAPLQTGNHFAELDPRGWGRELAARPISVPGDPSSAAFLVAAGLMCPGQVTLENIALNPTRTGFLDILKSMGAALTVEPDGEDRVEPTGRLCSSGGRGLAGTVVEGDVVVRAIDELPILAIVAARAEGTTEFRDAAELRVKESDRIATTCELLRRLGVEVEEREDGMLVQGQGDKPFSPCQIAADGDHRIAMSAAIAGLTARGPVRVDDAGHVNTSFPTFVAILRSLGATVDVQS